MNDTLDTIIAEMQTLVRYGDVFTSPYSRIAGWADRLAALQREPVAWMTHHDCPMLFPTRDEAGAYCDDDEEPIPLYAAPPAPAVPEGWQLVPVEPTPEMLVEGWMHVGEFGCAGGCYRAMLAAAKENTSE